MILNNLNNLNNLDTPTKFKSLIATMQIAWNILGLEFSLFISLFRMFYTYICKYIVISW